MGKVSATAPSSARAARGSGSAGGGGSGSGGGGGSSNGAQHRRRRREANANADAAAGSVSMSASDQRGQGAAVAAGGSVRKLSPSPSKAKARSVGSNIDSAPLLSLETLPLSLASLRQAAQQHDLDAALVDAWSVREDGRLVDPERRAFKTLRDALRSLYFSIHQRISRHDIYFVAILRRQLAELELPLVDGPIAVQRLGRVVARDQFFSLKKLFPIGYEAIASVVVASSSKARVRVQCSIVEGNSKQSPIFVVSLVRDPDCIFRSYVISKAWSKTMTHLGSLSREQLSDVAEPRDSPEQSEALSSTGNEDGFGLLRRNVARVLEGLPMVQRCGEYQFWEERHPVSVESHAKLRARLVKQLKHTLKARGESKERIQHVVCQEEILAENERSPEEIKRERNQRELDQRAAEKRRIREEARMLLEEERKVQQETKEAMRKEKEDRKNALLEAKQEAVRRKEARKEAQRREKEEERRMREEEKEMRRFLREEERQRKAEEKVEMMKRRVANVHERRILREQQKSFLENGVQTTVPARGHTDRPDRFAKPVIEISPEQQRAALLQFVREERDRRRRIRLWERRRAVERAVWIRTKEEFTRLRDDKGAFRTIIFASANVSEQIRRQCDFPRHSLTPISELVRIPEAFRSDAVFVWDAFSTFADCLRLTSTPRLEDWIKMLVRDDRKPTTSSDGMPEDILQRRESAGFVCELLKVLVSEYFPMLQISAKVEEFFRTRPVNAYTWPEVARQVCLLALDSTHPNDDDVTIRSLKGSRSYRDDSVILPLQQRLQERGSQVLRGEKYVEREKDYHQASPSRLAAPSTHDPSYGIVLPDGVRNALDIGCDGDHFVINSIRGLAAKTEESDTSSDQHRESDPLARVRVGHYLVALNGHVTTGMTQDELNALIDTTPCPHGLLVSSAVPPTKNTHKHVPTTQSAPKLKRCLHVLKILRAKPIAAPFNDPVDGDLYPDYYSSGVITDPMDLGTIQEKIEDGDYENDDDVDSFQDDVALVWNNCYAFNSPQAEISSLARKLAAIFERLMEEWVNTEVVRPLVSIDEEHCHQCRTNHAKQCLLLCDRCDAAYHTCCLTPPLPSVPQEEWFCPRCLPVSSKWLKKSAATSSAAGERNPSSDLQSLPVAQSELDEKIQGLLGILSKEDSCEWSDMDFVAFLRVCCELLLQTGVVQQLYQTIEDKSADLRKQYGESLADLEQEWERFEPSRGTSGHERTERFIIDGAEHELTEGLLQYLEEKAHAEAEGKTIPPLPDQADGDGTDLEDESGTDTSGSDDDDEALIEVFGDAYLQERDADSRANSVGDARVSDEDVCEYCGLEDGILNGPLKRCKCSPLTHHVSDIDDFELPDLLSESDERLIFTVEIIQPNESADISFVSSSGGLLLRRQGSQAPQLSEGDAASMGGILYSVNDRVVCGLSRDDVLHMVRNIQPPILMFSSSISAAVVQASVSIVTPRFALPGIDLAIGPQGYIYVQSFSQAQCPGFAELCGQIFPGDVLLMVRDQHMRGRSIEDVLQLLEDDSSPRCLVFVRQPSDKMRQAVLAQIPTASIVASMRARVSALQAALVQEQRRLRREIFEVTFHDGPLGLALSLDTQVTVKSLNDNPDGTLGQASRCGKIREGDILERVNGKVIGPLRDLSQFTAYLLSLERPLAITFSREQQYDASIVECPYGDLARLRHCLGVEDDVLVKTLRVDQLPPSFAIADFEAGCTVLHTACELQCEAGAGPVEIGDLLVGVNGLPIAQNRWSAVMTVLSSLAPPLFFHFLTPARPRRILLAHESCMHQANLAWSEAELLTPRIEQAQRVEAFIRRVVPRTLGLGKCRSGHLYFQFAGEPGVLFILTAEDGQWMQGQTPASIANVVRYLKQHPRDAKIAKRVESTFHRVLHRVNESQQRSGELCCQHSDESFLKAGPFALGSSVLATSHDGESDRFEASLSCYGRTYFLGSFHSRQDADLAVQHARRAMRNFGRPFPDRSSFQTSTLPVLKADLVVQRMMQRRYEHVGGTGNSMLLSQSIFHVLHRPSRAFLHSNDASPHPANGVAMQQQQQLAQAQDVHKRNIVEAAPRMMHPVPEQSRPNRTGAEHSRDGDSQSMPAAFDMQLSQSISPVLTNHARAMTMAWHNFTNSHDDRMMQMLVTTCLAGFDEVRKLTARVLNANSPLLDQVLFAGLHHSYVVTLFCAMATQTLSNSARSPGDCGLVQLVVDAATTALVSSGDGFSAPHARALSSFAAAVERCNPARRSPDWSPQLQAFGNVVLQFVEMTRYFVAARGDGSNGSVRCVPVLPSDQHPVVAMLPVPLVNQLRLLENARDAYLRRVAAIRAGGAPSSSNHSLPQSQAQGSFASVDFLPGPLGIMINHAVRGHAITVTEFSRDGAGIGQAEASGKISIGDEVYAVDGKLVSALGMEGFKQIVASGKRPLRVVFRKSPSNANSNPMFGRDDVNANMNQAAYATPPMRYPGQPSPAMYQQYAGMGQPQPQPQRYGYMGSAQPNLPQSMGMPMGMNRNQGFDWRQAPPMQQGPTGPSYPMDRSQSFMGMPPMQQGGYPQPMQQQMHHQASPSMMSAFVAPNDPSLPMDESSISYYDVNQPPFRAPPDFELAAPSASDTPADTASVSDVATEPDDDMQSVSTVETLETPNVSDEESEAMAAPHPSPSASAISVSTAASVSSSQDRQPSIGLSSDDMAAITARRSSRVSRKVRNNIADQYDPQLAAASNAQTTAGRQISNEPADGEVGVLATELLEPFESILQSRDKEVAPMLRLLRAQLLVMEAAIPRDAFRPGRWTRDIRAGWAELVFTAASSHSLLEGILFLESVIEADWLDSCWKSSYLPTAKNALANATFASAAMRLYALDDALQYLRAKRVGKKRQQQSRGARVSSQPSSPVKLPAPSPQSVDTSHVLPSHPSELVFMARLDQGTIALASKMIARVVEMQRDRTLTTYSVRKARREIRALTGLSEDEMEQWLRVAAHEVQHIPHVSHDNASSNDNGSRQSTPKRKQPLSSVAATTRPSRKRKVTTASNAPQDVELHCFQMHSPPYRIPPSNQPNATLQPRFALILSTLLKHDLAPPFAAPVDPQAVPGYAQVIREPMDLGTIHTRVLQGFYEQHYELLVAHVQLVWTNCFTFNRVDSAIAQSANRLRSLFNRLFEQWISEQPAQTAVTSLPSDEQCQHCHTAQHSESLLLCDSCDAPYHSFCLSPPLKQIPTGLWFCPRCPLQRVSVDAAPSVAAASRS